MAGLALYLNNNNNKLDLALSMNRAVANRLDEAQHLYEEAEHSTGAIRLNLLGHALRKGSVKAGHELWRHHRENAPTCQLVNTPFVKYLAAAAVLGDEVAVQGLLTGDLPL